MTSQYGLVIWRNLLLWTFNHKRDNVSISRLDSYRVPPLPA